MSSAEDNVDKPAEVNVDKDAEKDAEKAAKESSQPSTSFAYQGETAKVVKNSIVEKIIPASAKSVFAEGSIRPPSNMSYVNIYDKV